MKKLFTAAVITSLVFISCAKDNPEENIYTVSGVANGSLQVPENSSAAVANLSGTYNANANLLKYNVVWTGLSTTATAAHFHGIAAPGITANALYPLNVDINGLSGTASGEITVADSVENALLSGRIYYDIHSAEFPDGEIRGPVTLIQKSTK